MVNMPNILKSEEEAILALRDMYERRGYKKFRMSKFEEYDFYAKNKSFLQSDDILTFNDLSGKLLALKPDITLSIVKNVPDSPASPEKVYYNENVYRVAAGTHEFREIMQVGLEHIGEVDMYSTAEVMSLALESLRAISPRYLMDVSHVGLLAGLFAAAELDSDAQTKISACIKAKNAPEIRKVCTQFDVSEEMTARFEKLASIYGSFEEVVEIARELDVNETTAAAIRELEEAFALVQAMGAADNINIDFSIISDMSYYNGIVFQGFVEGIPHIVLSGGRYDKLLRRLGKKCGAIGFAVYLGVVDRYTMPERTYDVDVLLVYSEKTDPLLVINKVRELNESAQTVRVQKGDAGGISYRQKLVL